MDNLSLPKIDVGWLAGVDEAGRGPLAGPVVAGAVILDPDRPISGLTDSKRLSAVRRERLAEEIRVSAIAWALGAAQPDEIDRLNIFHATMLAMQRAVAGLSTCPAHALVDGNHVPVLSMPATAVVKGDLRVPVISAASILAKVARDALMEELDASHPVYGFAKNKGYPTRAHVEALSRFGPCPAHRRSYAPVRRYIVDTTSTVTTSDIGHSAEE